MTAGLLAADASAAPRPRRSKVFWILWGFDAVIALALGLAVPGLRYALFLLVVLIGRPRWN